MISYKKAKIVMLTTNNKTNLWESTKSNILRYSSACIDDMRQSNGYHLYIISDDEIKEGKENVWYYDSNFNKICKWIGESNTYVNKWFKKIIASTDTSLNEKDRFNGKSWNDLLPQPSQQFIEKYIESYNKGEIITDVLVEYELGLNNIAGDYKNIEILKVNPKDNTITIKKLKDSWNREEVVQLITKLSNQINITSGNLGLGPASLNKWIEENL